MDNIIALELCKFNTDVIVSINLYNRSYKSAPFIGTSSFNPKTEEKDLKQGFFLSAWTFTFAMSYNKKCDIN